ncbi:MAG TPA: hypothetical protein VKE91_09415, partial [Blastocatellia bacterium]|nr:hypothetical protein [Blastocatellia bacterium]
MLKRIPAALLLLAGISFPILAQSGSQRQSAPGNAKPDAQDPGATIKIETSLVTIPVSVLDRDGKFIPTMTRRDFHLYEDNVEQEITDFSS